MTTETNKLIAEFLGWGYKVLPIYSDDKFLGRKNIYNTPFKKHLKNKAFTTTFSENELVFHNDWNWLMEVVEKIESLDSGIYTLIFQQKSCLIWNNDKGEELEFFNGSFKGETKIEAVYNACVEFVKWYNENAVKS